MNDLEKNIGTTEPVSEPTDPAQTPVTPQLTLEPDPVVPEVAVPEEPASQNAAASSAQAFHMPEPPQAPEPTLPNYTAQYQYQQPQQNSYYNNQNPQYYKQYFNTPPAGYAQKSRLAAGLLAITLGVLGIHNFYLGFSSKAVIQLVVALIGSIFTCGVAFFAVYIWAFIEGIQILSANSPARLYDANGVILRD